MGNAATKNDEANLWADRLAVLRAAIDLGKPEAIDDVKRKIKSIDGKIEVLINRRDLIPQTLEGQKKQLVVELHDFAQTQRDRRQDYEQRAESQTRMVIGQIDMLVAQRTDLAKLVDQVKFPPREIDEGMTPEAFARPSRRDPILVLEEAEAINEKQAQAARQIARVFEAVTAAGQARIGRMDGTIGGGRTEMPEDVAVWHKERYLPWANHLNLHAKTTLDIVIKVAVMGIALDRVRRKHRIGYEGALTRLKEGLDLYWKRV